MSDAHSGLLAPESSADFYNWRFRNARISSGYTHQQLANRTNLSCGMIGHYESLRSWPRQDIARKIAFSLEKNVDEIFPERLKKYVRELKKEKGGGRNVRYLIFLKNKAEDGTASAFELKKIHELESLANYIPIEMVSEEQLIYERTPADAFFDNELKSLIIDTLDSLKPKEREVIGLYFGLGITNGYNLEEVGRIIGISRERARQLRNRAIWKLRLPLRATKLAEFLN